MSFIPLESLAPSSNQEEGAVDGINIEVTQNAQEKIKSILSDHQWVRVSIEGGGCTGMQYRFDLIENGEVEQDDIKLSGHKIVIDPISINYLIGAELDYVDQLSSSYFVFKNPNAQAQCGCGKSFAA